MKYVWKVVSVDIKGRYRSLTVPSYMRRHCLIYEVDKLVKSKEGPIFCYRTKKIALSKSDTFNYRLVLKCKPNTIRKPKIRLLPNIKFTRDISRFWRLLSKGYSSRKIMEYLPFWEVPSGTVFCDSLIPIEVYNYKGKRLK